MEDGVLDDLINDDFYADSADEAKDFLGWLGGAGGKAEQGFLASYAATVTPYADA